MFNDYYVLYNDRTFIPFVPCLIIFLSHIDILTRNLQLQLLCRTNTCPPPPKAARLGSSVFLKYGEESALK
jgi:hypothetical protein